MENQKWNARGRGSLALGIFLLASAYLPVALASSNGSVTSSQSCSTCHTDGVATLLIIGPETVLPHSDNTYTLTITGGPAVVGGLDVWAPDGGTLSVIDVLTQVNGGEITHTAPKAFSSGSVSWDFQWTAPGVQGFFDLMAQGVSANDGMGNGGDWAGTTSFAVQVIPIPATAFLFGSAVGLLGWFRRRVSRAAAT